MATLAEIAQGPTSRAPEPLRRFIWDMQSMVELAESEREILMVGRDLMARLLACDNWLPKAFASAGSTTGRQFHVYRDAMARFCVVSTLLPSGAGLLIEQPGAWEIAGVLAGAIARKPSDGAAAPRLVSAGAVETLRSGRDEGFLLTNALPGQVALSLHVYGGPVESLRRRLVSNGADDGRPLDWANGADAPPYDIFSIQSDARD